MFQRRRRSQPAVCYLVYARQGPEADEPLAAVVASEREAVALDARVRRQHPGLEVRWEEVPWHRSAPQREAREVHEIHVVATGAPDNTIGIGVFDDAKAADRVVSEGRSRGEDLSRRTVRVAEWLLGKFPLNG